MKPSTILKTHGPELGLVDNAVQQDFADYVYEGITKANGPGVGCGQLFAQGSTGTGKTVAYLLAGGLYCIDAGEGLRAGARVIVSTYYRSLQRQAYATVPGDPDTLDASCDVARALALLERATNVRLKVAILMGRSNYLDAAKALRHCRKLLEKQNAVLSDEDKYALTALIAWAEDAANAGAPIGEFLESYGTAALPAGLDASDIGIDSDTPEDSPSRQVYLAACARARAADILIVNHALLLVDRVYRGGDFLHDEADERPVAALIVDEAEKLEDAARGLLSDQVALVPLAATIREAAERQEADLAGKSLEALAAEVDAVTEMLIAAGLSAEEEMRARREFVLFYDDLPPAGRAALGDGMHALAEAFAKAVREMNTWDPDPELARLRDRLIAQARSVKSVREALRALDARRQGEAPQDDILAISYSPVLRQPSIRLLALNPARALTRAWRLWLYDGKADDGEARFKENDSASRAHALVLVSATLSAPNKSDVPDWTDIGIMFGIYDRSSDPRGGNPCAALNDERRVFAPTRFGSARIVFPHPDLPSVYVDAEAQEGEEEADFERDRERVLNPEWAEMGAAAIERAQARERGRILVLCNSFAATRLQAQAAREAGIEGVIERTAANTQAACIAAWAANPNGVFFTPSGWEGLDISQQVGPDGERLRNGIKHVIVTQLPFAPPDGALSQGYARHLMRRGISPLTAGRIVFGKALSRALIKLLQAFGRGIRHPEDSFTFWVLDPRFPRSPRLRKAFSASVVQERGAFMYAIPRRFRESVDGTSAWERGSVLMPDGRVCSVEEVSPFGFSSPGGPLGRRRHLRGARSGAAGRANRGAPVGGKPRAGRSPGDGAKAGDGDSPPPRGA